VIMVFVLDNYDSFTYNLVQYLGEMGVEICVKRNDEVSVEEIAASRPAAIVVSPGPGRPEDAGVTMDVICLGKRRRRRPTRGRDDEERHTTSDQRAGVASASTSGGARCLSS